MKKVTMYTGNPCSFCAAAKALLKTKNVEIEEIDIWADPANAKEMLQRTKLLLDLNLQLKIHLYKTIVVILNFGL